MKVLCDTLLLGVTGAISAASIPGQVLFLRRGLVGRIRVIMTASAARLVTPEALRAHAGGEVYLDTFESGGSVLVPHIELSRDADLFLVMPATANILAKAAHGIADDLLSSAVLASAAPVVFVPAMNGAMWSSRPVQANVALARGHGYHVLDPAPGIEVADLQPTHGGMPPLDYIIGRLAEILRSR